MVDVVALRQIFSVENAAWTLTIIIALLVLRMWNGAPAMFEQWIAYRRAKAEEKASDWSRLRDHCAFLMQAEERCRTELNEVKSRLATLEGFQIGMGEAKQQVAIIEGAERIIEESKGEGK